MTKASDKPIPVFYILGVGHSGSTLLDLILGSHSRIESIGEIKTLSKYLSPNSILTYDERICTCGVHAEKCEYWSEVLDRFRSTSGMSLPDFYVQDDKQFERPCYHLFRAILDVSGKKVICDSSKRYSHVLQMVQSPLFRPYVVHLVRDGHAVGYSIKRKAKRSGKTTGKRYNYYWKLWSWNKSNVKYYKEFKDLDTYFCLRYEDFVADPAGYLRKILGSADLDFEKGQLEFYNFQHHNLGGNNMRRRGKQEIRADMEYLTALSGTEWALGTAIAYRSLRQFGYPLRRRRPDIMEAQ